MLTPEKMYSAIVCLVSAGLGVVAAWLWFNQHRFAMVTMFVVLFGAAQACDSYARSLLAKYPERAALWLEFWVLLPVALAGVLSGVLILLTVYLEPKEYATVVQKKLLAATMGAVSGVVTTLAIKSLEGADSDLVGSHIKKAFQSIFQRVADVRKPKSGVVYLAPDSYSERLVFSDTFKGISGWGWKSRRRRAAELSQHLTSDAIS